MKLKLETVSIKGKKVLGYYDSVKDAQNAYRSWSDDKKSSQVEGANLYDENNAFVGFFSYNGRFWPTSEEDYKGDIITKPLMGSRIR